MGNALIETAAASERVFSLGQGKKQTNIFLGRAGLPSPCLVLFVGQFCICWFFLFPVPPLFILLLLLLLLLVVGCLWLSPIFV
jgi:hypothetical protein